MSDIKKAHNQAQEALRKMKEKQEVTEESQEYAEKLKKEHQEFMGRQERLKNKEQEKSPYAPPGSPYRTEDDRGERRRKKARRVDERSQRKKAGRRLRLDKYLKGGGWWVIGSLSFLLSIFFWLSIFKRCDGSSHSRLSFITAREDINLPSWRASETDDGTAEEEDAESSQDVSVDADSEYPDNAGSEDDIERAIAAQDAAIASDEGSRFASLEDSIRCALRETTFKTEQTRDAGFLYPACFKLSYNYNGIKDDYGVGYVMGDDIVLDACERGILSTEDFLTENAQYHKLLDEIDPAIIVKSQTDGQLQYFITKKAKDGMTFIRKNYLYYNPERDEYDRVRKGELSLEYPSKYEPEMRRIVQTIFSSSPFYND